MTSTEIATEIQATRVAIREASELIDQQARLIRDLMSELEKSHVLLRDALKLAEHQRDVATAGITCR